MSSDIQGSIRPTQIYGMANLITLRDVLRMVGKPVFNHRVFFWNVEGKGMGQEDVLMIWGGGTRIETIYNEKSQ